MPTTESRYGVWLDDERVGTLHHRGDYTWFAFSDEYLNDPRRSVLGLVFEHDLTAEHASALRLPPWFSNLLPEGRLRQWIAADRGVSVEREMELLAQVGHDLPGAVRVLREDLPPDDGWHPGRATADPYGDTGMLRDDHPAAGWRFSLAGVGLKFSMLRKDDRLTLPAYGEGGDWIVKLPDRLHADVPRNEFAMMTLAAEVGIEVPERLLVHRDQLENLPPNVWPNHEEFAYAVARFDRDSGRRRVHIEDFAQVRNFYPNEKYRGNFETLASLIYRRGKDLPSLREFARRMAFNILINNGDAHLKNWSLIYRDRRVPTLAPAYDLVSTGVYRIEGQEDLGLKFGKTRRFDRVSLATFSRLERLLGVEDGCLQECVVEVADRVRASWPATAELLEANPALRDAIGQVVADRYRTLLRT